MKYILVFLFIFSGAASAERTVWEYVDKKLEKKEFERWSLSSWLYQKDKMRLQDQWLAMNLGGDGIFTEFYLDYGKTEFDQDTQSESDESKKGGSTEVAAYLGFLGFIYRYEKYDDLYFQKEGSINLRIIGSSHQSTHLVLTYGNRRFEDESLGGFDQKFWGGDISLYLLPFLGFDGRYRVYGKETSGNGQYEVESKRTQWGAFVDIKFLRIFAYQFEEDFILDEVGSSSNTDRQVKGTAMGLRLYF